MDDGTRGYYETYSEICVERWASLTPGTGVGNFFDRAFPTASTVLDIGCGSGRDLAHLASLGHTAYGVEPVAEFREHIEEQQPALRDRVAAGELPSGVTLPDGWPPEFDGVICSAMLQHLPKSDLADALATIGGLLSANGRLLLSIPDERPDIVNDRDGAGRLFSGVQAEELELLSWQTGFHTVGKWRELPDGQGRARHAWAILLLEQA